MTDNANIWRSIITDKQKSWVLFENGTCVILMQPENDLLKQAQDLLSQYGHVVPGTSSGDFSVLELEELHGWVVTGQHPDILNYVSPDEVTAEGEPESLVAGLIGRWHRENDATNLKVAYVHDRRSP